MKTILLKSILGSVSSVLRVFFKGRHRIGRLEWPHVIFNLKGKSFHCRSRTASDMTCEVDWYYFRRRV